jgi:hypothetical protein
VKLWPQFGWWRSWISIALLCLAVVGCGKTPAPPAPPPPMILPSATVGQAYSYTFGAAPSTFSASGVPSGLQVTIAGSNLVLVGTPKQPGLYTFTVNSTNQALEVRQ